VCLRGKTQEKIEHGYDRQGIDPSYTDESSKQSCGNPQFSS